MSEKIAVIVGSGSEIKRELLSMMTALNVTGEAIQSEPCREFEIQAMDHDLKASVTLDTPVPEWRGNGKRKMGRKR